MLLALALQAATMGTMPARVAPPVPARFSILQSDCPTPTPGGDIVVCARPDQATPRLPLPGERPPVAPLMIPGAAERMVDSQPRPVGGAPCAARMEGCLIGFGPPVNFVTLAKEAVHLLKTATARKPDKSRRVAIPLDDLPSAPAGN